MNLSGLPSDYGITQSAASFWANLTMIPSIVAANIPAFFGFAAADYAAAIAMSMIPQVGGAVGLVERAGIYGAMKVVDHATWQAFNRSPVVGH